MVWRAYRYDRYHRTDIKILAWTRFELVQIERVVAAPCYNLQFRLVRSGFVPWREIFADITVDVENQN